MEQSLEQDEAKLHRCIELQAAYERGRTDERERIARALKDEADGLACEEDARVLRGAVWLIGADFSHEEAERLQDEAEAQRAQLDEERRAEEEAAVARAARRDEPSHAPDPGNPYGPF